MGRFLFTENLMNRTRFSQALLLALTLGLIGASAQPASAQVFLSPIVGYNYGGDSGCPSLTGCEDKNLNIGIAFGNYGTLFGLEEEFAYAKDFYGNTPSYESSVATLMTNFLVSPNMGSVKPYGLIGIGLIKSNVEFGQLNNLTSNLNTIAWDLGGGLAWQMSDRFGVRGDIRFFRAMKDREIFGIQATGSKIEFSRIGAGFLVFF
jgi:opacity protein-like surface antigen